MKNLKCVPMLALLLALLCAPCARAEQADIAVPQKGIAVAAPREKTGTVPMFEKASEDSAVLMEYYSGTRLTVVGYSGGMARVQAGEKGASLMGYMRADDLRYGAAAECEVPRCAMGVILNEDVEVRAYPAADAPLLGVIKAGYGFTAVSRNDGKWVQLEGPASPVYVVNRPEPEGETDGFVQSGFAYLPTGTAMGSFDEQLSWLADPGEDDMPYEQAVERAKELALEHPESLALRFPDGVTREQLDAMYIQANFTCLGVGNGAIWQIFFQQGNDYELNFCVTMNRDGSMENIESGNG